VARVHAISQLESDVGKVYRHPRRGWSVVRDSQLGRASHFGPAPLGGSHYRELVGAEVLEKRVITVKERRQEPVLDRG